MVTGKIGVGIDPVPPGVDRYHPVCLVNAEARCPSYLITFPFSRMPVSRTHARIISSLPSTSSRLKSNTSHAWLFEW